jgi:hypothetical protein
MAILKGFPPSNTISASVRITEKDQSFYDAGTVYHKAGLVGFASKGPIGIPTLITSRAQLTEVFGNPHPELSDPYLIYAAQQYLAIANNVWIVRVGAVDPVDSDAATTATVGVPSAGGQVIATSNIASPVSAPAYSFDVDSYFRWKLNGVLASKTLVILADASRPAPLAGLPYSCLQLAEDLNLQLVDDDGIEFFCTVGEEIGVRTTWAYGPDASIELMSVANAIYGGSVISDGGTNVTGLGTGMTRAVVTGTTEGYPASGSLYVSGQWVFTSVAAGFNLEVVVSGTDQVAVDNVVQVVDLDALRGLTRTTAQIVTEINTQIASLPGGFAAVGGGVAPADIITDIEIAAAIAANTITLITLHHGRDAKILVKADSTGDVILGLPNITEIGTSPEGTSGDVDVDTAGIIYGDANLTGDLTFTINADSTGYDGNNTVVKIVNDIRQSTFTLQVYQNSVQVEVWGNLTKDETSSYYVEQFIATVSSWIRVVDITTNPAGPLDGEYTLVGGSDGIPADPDEQDVLLIGDLYSMSGLYSLSEPEQIDIDLLACPGHSSTQVIEAMIDVCQNQRTDCLAIVDPPFGLYLQEIIDWHNGRHPLNDTKLDTDFAALYWPWVKIRDNYNLVYMWAPPSGSVLATIARSDSLSAPWIAPAGMTRGVVPNILDVFDRPTLSERDLLQGYRNAVNPIIQFNDSGFIIWGQKTLQRRPTALDRVNVRRMMFVAEKQIRTACRSLLFEPHDDLFHNQFIAMATSILTSIKNSRGLTAFKIQADWELNTVDRVNRNEFWAKIGIQPTKAVEFIFIEFSVHNQGNWEESSSSFV